jgi:hypothetical protein
MSLTLSPGFVNSSHWTYIAAAMAEGLDKAADKSETSSDLFPGSVLQAAHEFFQTVSDAVENRNPANAAAMAANYFIAAQALRSIGPERESRKELKNVLQNYAKIVESLDTPHRMNGEETRYAKDLSRFFRCIAENGEMEAYEQHVSFGQD